MTRHFPEKQSAHILLGRSRFPAEGKNSDAIERDSTSQRSGNEASSSSSTGRASRARNAVLFLALPRSWRSLISTRPPREDLIYGDVAERKCMCESAHAGVHVGQAARPLCTRGEPERTERARVDGCRFAVDPCRTTLRYLCGRNHADTPGLPQNP